MVVTEKGIVKEPLKPEQEAKALLSTSSHRKEL
jgi:hypothetical protein